MNFNFQKVTILFYAIKQNKNRLTFWLNFFEYSVRTTTIPLQNFNSFLISNCYGQTFFEVLSHSVFMEFNCSSDVKGHEAIFYREKNHLDFYWTSILI